MKLFIFLFAFGGRQIVKGLFRLQEKEPSAAHVVCLFALCPPSPHLTCFSELPSMLGEGWGPPPNSCPAPSGLGPAGLQVAGLAFHL